MNGHLVAKNSAESLLKHQKLVVKHTYTHTQSFSEMIIQYIHRTCWRLAWGKQLLIASNPLQFVWDHLSGLLCFSVVTLWKPIGWQLMYGLLQSPQPGPRDPATPFSPCLLSFASVLSYYFSLSVFCFTECSFSDHGVGSLHLPGALCQFNMGRSRRKGTGNCVHVLERQARD